MYARILSPLTSIKRKTGEIEELENPRYSITLIPDAASLKLIAEKSIGMFESDGVPAVQATKTVWKESKYPQTFEVGKDIIIKDPAYKDGEWVGNGSKGKIRCTMYDRKGSFEKGLNLVKVLLEEWKPAPKEVKEKINKNEQEKAKSVSQSVIDSEVPF